LPALKKARNSKTGHQAVRI